MAHDRRKTELIAALDRARSRLAAHSQALRADLDPRLRLERTFQRRPLAWLGGATLVGLLASRLPTRRPAAPRPAAAPAQQPFSAAVALGALKLAATLAKPMLTTWLSQRWKHP